MSWLQRLSAALRPKRGGDKDKPPPSERGWTDREISKIEDDRFGFRDYAEVLAGRARTAVPPLTIGLYGSWGSGKTSLMRLMEQELKGVEAIWINVWQLSNQDEVWQAFLQALFNRVNSKLRWWQRIEWGKLLRSLAVNSYRVVVVITPLILGAFISNPDATWRDVLSLLSLRLSASTGQTAAVAGTVTSYALALWLVVKPAIEAAREVVNIDVKSLLKYGNFEVQISELMQLQKRFAGMVNDLVGKDGRLVVFIDDLDRCTPGKIPELLEAIKLFTTTPKGVYILGLDYDIVREGISHRYSFIEEDATDYLEKIVQIPFHMPPLDESKIRDFVQEDYPEISQRCPTAAEVFSKGLEPNPRKVKRALNIYRTVLELADKRVSAWEMDPVNDELVAKMVVIQSRLRLLHERLVRQPDFLTKLEGKVSKTEQKLPAVMKLQELEPALFGKQGEPGLVKESDAEALVEMLSAGKHRFSSADQKEQVSSYIYLIATAEGGARGIRPSRREREILLGGEEEKIKIQVDEIIQNKREAVYIQRLRGAIEDHARYLPAEIVSANIALDLLEGWTREDFEPQTVRVPAGKFLMGSSTEALAAIGSGVVTEWLNSEQPQHEVYLSEYRIGRYPINQPEYLTFLQESGHQPVVGIEFRIMRSASHPATGLLWQDMVAYCEWLTQQTGRYYRLPTEAEWEKASRGEDGRIYPWGNDWDPAKCNNEEAKQGASTAVNHYSPGGDSPYGAADMAGNVWEWCADWFTWDPYAQRAAQPAKDPTGPEAGSIISFFNNRPGRVMRGGAFDLDRRYTRCAVRVGWDPELTEVTTAHWFFYTESRQSLVHISPGFRVVADPINVPDWQREEIAEWEQPPAEYTPAPLGSDIVNAFTYPDIQMPFSRPLFGRDKVPFELEIEGRQNLLKGIELSVSRDTSPLEASTEIQVGALNARSAFVLLTAGNARQQIGDVKLEGMKIGFLEFQFEGGDTLQVDLVIGKNIRDWSYKHPDVIGTLSDHRVQQVWHDPKDEATTDMLRINFPSPPPKVNSCQIHLELENLGGVSENILLPTIRVSGLTYLVDLRDLLSGDSDTINAQVEQIQEWGAEQECISHLTAVLADPEKRSRREVISANTALDLLEGWTRQEFEPETVRIPAGNFLMGSDPEKDHDAFQNEQPQHQVYLPDYRVGRYPVTNAEYNFFVAETGHPPPTHWLRWEDIIDANFLPSKGDHPVVNVSWQGAVAYCEWLSEKTGRNYLLPSEAEWEKAARGIHGRRYPWGNAWEEEKFNTLESNIGGTTPVGQFSPAGDSPFGASDMAGNVWEWTRSILSGYPYNAKDGREDIKPDAAVLRVMRGGAFHKEHELARCAFRGNQTPSYRVGQLGFRVVISL